MKKVMSLTLLLTGSILLQASSAHGQWTIQGVQFQVPEALAKKAIAKYGSISETPAQAFVDLAAADGIPLALDETTIYVRENGDYAADMIGPQGKMKFVYENKTQSFSVVQYGNKSVMKGNRKDVEETSEQVSSAMSDIEKKMAEAMKDANLTPEQEKAARRYLPGFKATHEEDPAEVEDTGDTRKVANRGARRFVVTQSDETTTVWASNDDKKLAQTARHIHESMSSMAKMGKKEKNEIEHLPEGYFPLEVIVENNRMGRSEVRVNQTKKIVSGDPGSAPFKVPGKAEGFKVTTMKEAMQGMMPKN